MKTLMTVLMVVLLTLIGLCADVKDAKNRVSAQQVDVVTIQLTVNAILNGDTAVTHPELDFNQDAALDVVDVQTLVHWFLTATPLPFFYLPHLYMPVNQPFGVLALAENGSGTPFVFRITSGALPPGLSMFNVVWPGGTWPGNPNIYPVGSYVLEISGTPTALGTYPIEIELEDSQGGKFIRQVWVVVQP